MAREESQKMRKAEQDRIMFQSQLEVPSKSQVIHNNQWPSVLYPYLGHLFNVQLKLLIDKYDRHLVNLNS
jgi:hypothetical protein